MFQSSSDLSSISQRQHFKKIYFFTSERLFGANYRALESGIIRKSEVQKCKESYSLYAKGGGFCPTDLI